MKKDIIKIVRAYKAGSITKREIVTELSRIILSIPRYFGYNCNDLIYDYYAKIISNIEKILSRYKELPTATFSTWFNQVLKLEFFTFIKQYKKNEFDYREYSQERIVSSYGENGNSELIEKIKSSKYDFLTDKEKKIFMLKYGVLEEESKNSESLQIILEKLNKKRRIEDNISRRYLQIINLQKKIILETDVEIKNKLREKLERVKKGKRRMEKVYDTLILLPTNEWVGEKIGVSKNTIATFLGKIKKKIVNNISEAEYSA